jgi:hypothetical protein
VKHAKVNIDDESVASSAAAAAAASMSALPGSNKLRERDIRKSLLFLVRTLLPFFAAWKTAGACEFLKSLLTLDLLLFKPE